MDNFNADDHNPVDPNLTERLGAAVDGIDATPDLAGVIAGADRRRRRSRSIGLGGAAAVVALGIGGVVLVSNRDTSELPAAQPEPVVVPLTTLAPGGEPTGDETSATEVPDEGMPTTEPSDDDASAAVEVPPFGQQDDPNAPDPAEPYLADTEEIYRRVMPNGYDFQIRASRQSYGELFGIEWDLPTGSAAECLGGPAVFVGNPDRPAQWHSTWTVQQWWPVGTAQNFQVTEHYTDETSNLIVRTELDASAVTIMQGNEVTDRADFVNGVAVVEMLPFGNGQFDDETGPMLSIAVESADGVIDVQTMPVYSDQFGERSIPQSCLGPPFPGSELPPPGAQQPADPAAAEAAVRERHALLVDRSLTDDERPVDLLTDDTGVAEARAQMEAGAYAESAAEAEYTIDGLVFTDAENAWFEYTIVAPTGTFGNRFGQAVFNGEVWQISRQTICQDLSLAGGPCGGNEGDGSSQQVQPPLADGTDIDDAINTWQAITSEYGNKLYCNPLNPCGDFDLSTRLPEPGEQPADAGAERSEVIELMESIYGDGALLAQLDRIDDPTGIAETVERMADGGFGDEVDSASATVEELVFTAPNVAVFRYSIRTDGYTFTDRIGFATEIDGVWKIARDTICTDLSLAGSGCEF